MPIAETGMRIKDDTPQPSAVNPSDPTRSATGSPVSSPAWETMVSIPRRIGRYTIVRKIDEGGMGIVYEATQDKPVRSVALKVLKSGLMAGANLRRFQTEAQILADLHHDHIAQVFEAGVHHDAATGLAVPYFAMEYIAAAAPLTDFAVQAGLDVRERLTLFLDVLSAVGAAHRKEIVHRDLKPSNILVDANGVVKVIDFGVARTNEQSHAAATQAGSIIGTLEFMSPEQLGDQARVIDTRSDVYTLGVILHLLLANEMPYDVSRTDVSKAATTVLHTNPKPLPKLAVSSPRDLTTIIGRAMVKDRRRRMGSVEEMASEIRRYLDGRPIDSRPDTWYRLAQHARRFLSRNPILAFLMAVVAALVLSYYVIIPGLFRYTPLPEWFERKIAAASPPPFERFNHVRVIEIRDGIDFAALAQQVGIVGVENGNTPAAAASRRLLQAAVVRRLIDSGAIALGFDLMIRTESVHTRPLIEAWREFRASGKHLVVAQPQWFPSESLTVLPLSPEILKFIDGGGAISGGITVRGLDEGTVTLDIAMQRGATPPVPSLVAALYGAVKVGAPKISATFDDKGQYLGLSRGDLRAGQWVDSEIRIAITTVTESETDDPKMGVRKGDRYAALPFSVPTAEQQSEGSVGIDEVLTATPERLRQLFQGRVALFGDVRPSANDILVIKGVGSMPGVWAHAAGLERLFAGVCIRFPSGGMSLFLTVLLSCCGATVALAVRSLPGRAIALVVLAAAAVTSSSLLLTHYDYFVNPVPIVVAAILGFGFMILLDRRHFSGIST